MQLTDEQQAVIAHDDGPALVFAVAGAGKTTSMVHRIERLVREKRFQPQRILATTFSKAAVEDLRSALRPWSHCRAVKVVTLHAFGFAMLRFAAGQGLYDPAYLNLERVGPTTDKLPQTLIRQAANRARRLNRDYKGELDNFDPEDFETYVSACKGKLQYANLEGADLPDSALRVASQAQPPEAPLEWYLDFYQLYEQERIEQQLLTFDDMLLSAWELLHRHPQLLTQVQQQQDTVLCDEYQDVNLVQADLLDLITASHRNYMVVGDDDQTIYSWRGSDCRFILDFADRYGAKVFTITDNFRCGASHIALANRVIEHNRTRYRKRLSLTRGLRGHTHLHPARHPRELAETVVKEVLQSQERGTSLAEMVILVRTYGQTPPLEQAFLNAQIPYRVVGNLPFYRRPEILGLLKYLELAQLEQRRLSEGLTPVEQGQWGACWLQIYNTPLRYIPRAVAEEIREGAVLAGECLVYQLRKTTADQPEWLQRRLRELAQVLEWVLSQTETTPAASVLAELESRLGYCRYLTSRSQAEETGQSRAENVRAAIQWSQGFGSVGEFLAHLQKLEQPDRDQPHCLTLMSIHRAKGLEWETVFLPFCNDKVIPQARADREEERRLLYVALTRSRRDLHLLWLKDEPISPFLQESQCQRVLEQCQTLTRIYEHSPREWSAHDLVTLVRLSPWLGLPRYLSHYGEQPPTWTAIAAERLQQVLRIIQTQGWETKLGVDLEQLEAWEKFGALEEFPGAALIEELRSLLPTRPGSAGRVQPKPALQEWEDPSLLIGKRVRHGQFGVGRVVALEGRSDDPVAVVSFDTVGKKRLLLRLAPLELLA
uniref:DNA 3'-5' helicase n=1 Tax=Cyanothece sp. (strain PCC 7425 / ATCC 29141) TaxID=395961 RepID=B8HWJ9_CYAP4